MLPTGEAHSLRKPNVATLDEAQPIAEARAEASDSGARERVRQAIVANFRGMWRLLRRMRVPPDALEDAVQEVFLVAVRRMSDIKPGSERSYLYGVALRIAAKTRSASSRLAPQESVEQPDPGPLPDALADRRRALEHLDRALDAMGEDLRAVFVLFEIEGLTLPEIASITEVPLGTATSRLRRARETFQQATARLRAGARRSGGPG